MKKPRIPVVSNVDAAPHSDPAVIKDILKKQVRMNPDKAGHTQLSWVIGLGACSAINRSRQGAGVLRAVANHDTRFVLFKQNLVHRMEKKKVYEWGRASGSATQQVFAIKTAEYTKSSA